MPSTETGLFDEYSTETGLFNEYIKPITNIDKLILEIDENSWDFTGEEIKFLNEFEGGKNRDRRDHLTAIIALQHYLEDEVKIVAQEAYEKRRATVIDGAEKIQRLYLSYISNANKSHGFNGSNINLNTETID